MDFLFFLRVQTVCTVIEMEQVYNQRDGDLNASLHCNFLR